MEICVFDVGNASCNYICSPNRYAMMIDCGSCSDKDNPVDIIKNWQNDKDLKCFKAKNYVAESGRSYPLALLHITHPDNDHVRNADRVNKELTPFLLKRVYSENFDDAGDIDKAYIKDFDKPYRSDSTERINWGFDVDNVFSIPINKVKDEPALKGKVRNNSSIIRYISYKGVRILFTGDLETAGWEWLTQHNSHFCSLMRQGLDILIAPHHGHESGFPKALFDLTGNVKVIILSKDTEASKEKSDVYKNYSNYADGIKYLSFNERESYRAKVMTTRSNGNIYIMINEYGNMEIGADKASSNHQKIV